MTIKIDTEKLIPFGKEMLDRFREQEKVIIPDSTYVMHVYIYLEIIIFFFSECINITKTRLVYIFTKIS